MLYAIILPLKNWVHWHIYGIKAWLERHPDWNHPGREQSTKDMRELFNLYYTLNFMTEQ
jgi:phosphatidylethanolamine-binding protein (PEBP) family uncharacterized protein